MKKDKSFTIFLLDDDSTGRIKCGNFNWSGVAYKIPQKLINKDNSIQHLKYAGVYFLFGTDDEDNDVVYIGQGINRKNGEGVLCRIKEPHDKINYWHTAVIFTNKENAFGPTEISYLENKFCNMAKKSNRFIVKNVKEPNPGILTEEKQNEMDVYIDYAVVIMGILGYPVFEPLIKGNKTKEKSNILTYKFKGLTAFGMITNEGFVVLKGSQLSNQFAARWKDKLPVEREKYKDKIKNNVLINNILFKSPSGAANFCSGHSVSGNKCWIDEKGKPLKDLLIK